MSGENWDTSVAWSFHNATKYVWLGDEAAGRWFGMGTPPDVEAPIWEKDWSLEPFPFKIYETIPQVAIPRNLPPSPIPALQAIARTGAEGAGEAFPDRATLARIGLLSNGLLGRQFKRREATADFRTAGATGARYHLELYFVCADLPDLPAGIYHYAAHDHSLGRLRAGDYRAALAAAAGGEPARALAPFVLAMTSTFWRNAWRYKARVLGRRHGVRERTGSGGRLRPAGEARARVRGRAGERATGRGRPGRGCCRALRHRPRGSTGSNVAGRGATGPA